MTIEVGTKILCYQFLDERYPDRWTLIEVTRTSPHFCFFAESRSVPIARLPIEHLEKGRYSIKDFTFWIATPEDLEKFHNAKKKAELVEAIESVNLRKLSIESLQQILSIVEAKQCSQEPR